MTSHNHQPTPEELPFPSTAQLLDEVLTLGREVHLEMDEPALVERFLTTLATLFPQRAFAVRALDPRSPERARSYAAGATLRKGVDAERISVKESSIEKTRLKSALVESACIRVTSRWDSPFPGIAAGFNVPLVASGELYGVLDVGYPLGHDLTERDQPLVVPIANHLSVALRNERLHRDTTLLRDYQAKLIDNANALILGVDRHWRITVCNKALCRLMGYERSEVVGRDARDWLAGDDSERLTAVFHRALSGELDATGSMAADPVNVSLRTRTGSVRTVWSVAAVGTRGRIEAVVAIGQDQTKLFELQRQIIQAEKLATLGQLAAGVVHELNNPLTSISVYAEYLERKLGACLVAQRALMPEPADVEKARRIVASAQRISSFTQDLVQYARPGGHQLGMVDVNSVVMQSLSLCEHLFERSGIELVRDLAAGLPSVAAVPGQLEQVVINLVTNAAQAVDQSGGRVTVHSYHPEPGYVAVAVADSGSGIVAELRERVFEPFFTTKTDGKGTGLGLSIVRNIVEQHNGQVTVSAAAEGGARFVVMLPAL